MPKFVNDAAEKARSLGKSILKILGALPSVVKNGVQRKPGEILAFLASGIHIVAVWLIGFPAASILFWLIRAITP